MQSNHKQRPIAQDQRWLYAYAILTIVLSCIGSFRTLHTNLPLQNNPYISPADQHLFIYQTLVLSVAVQIALMVYLVTSRNVKHILLLLKIILALEAFGFVASLFRPNVYSVLISLAYAILTAAMIKLLQPIKRSTEKREKATAKRAEPTTSASEARNSKFNDRLKKILRVLFRINTAYWGLALLWLASYLLRIGHDAAIVTRLFIPFVILGLLYVTPYYLFKDKLRIAYVGTLILMTALTIVSLHIPVHPGRLAPANLPFPQNFNQATLWLAFRASPAFTFYGALIVFDATTAWTRRYAQRSEEKRAAITLAWVAVFIGCLIIGGAVGHRPTTHKTTSQIPSQKLQAYSFPKYKFEIGFPNKPSATSDTEELNRGDTPLPYTQYESDVYINTIRERIYRVYAYKWPPEDGTLVGLDKATLISSLKTFIDYDIQNLQAKRTKITTKYILSGKKLAVEATFTMPQQYASSTTGYVRVFANGSYEYDIEAIDISRSDFDNFADSFRLTVPVVPDISRATNQ